MGDAVNLRRHLVTVGVAIACAGCSLIQPSSRGAPIADTVGAVLMAGGTTVAVVAAPPNEAGRADFTESGGATAAVCTFGGLTLIYTLSALYGFTRDPKTQNSDEPILGLVILSGGLAGFARGARAGSSDHRGCCSYHGGIGDGCDDGRLICADGTTSPTCACD